MITHDFFRRYCVRVCLSVVLLAVARPSNAEDQSHIAFQWLDSWPRLDLKRADEVGKAIDFESWPRADVYRVAPPVDKVLLTRPELATRESTSYSFVGFDKDLWGRSRHSWGHLIERDTSSITKLPQGRKEYLLQKLSPELRNDPNFVREFLERKLERYKDSKKHELDGQMQVEVLLAPSAAAAQEYLLAAMIRNTMPTEHLLNLYRQARHLEGLGPTSFLTQSRSKNQTSAKFVCDNVCFNIWGNGCFSDEVVLLARKLRGIVMGQELLTLGQLRVRRPVIIIGSPTGETSRKGLRVVSYEVSLPDDTSIVRFKAIANGSGIATENGKMFLPAKEGSAKLSLTAITNELLVGTSERLLTIH